MSGLSSANSVYTRKKANNDMINSIDVGEFKFQTQPINTSVNNTKRKSSNDIFFRSRKNGNNRVVHFPKETPEHEEDTNSGDTNPMTNQIL
jgi:hypothetical protein